MQNLRKHYFPADDLNVMTYMTAKGDFGAYVWGRELVRGYGHSRLAAIADLNEAIGNIDEPEEIDHQAQRWDHQRDLRKHSW